MPNNAERSATPASGSQRDQFLSEAARQLGEAAASKKCWSCGCLHDSLAAIEKSLIDTESHSSLREAVKDAQARVTDRRYDCLGCETCYPPLVMNALENADIELDLETVCCSHDQVKERKGWPSLPGNYVVLRYQAPVAVCTLTNESLMNALAAETRRENALIGTLQTENLGIERLITNILANPNIRFLVICGSDSRQAVGHLPGQSLLQLGRAGMDGDGRIIGAKGKRPFIRNIPREMVEQFRERIEVVDLIGTNEIHRVMESVRTCVERYPGPAEAFDIESAVRPIMGYIPERMTSDPMGYFVIYADRARGLISMEHYSTDGIVDAVIEGQKAAELYFPAVDRGLVMRLDHAAYLGRELERAERSIKTGENYVQDMAPENITKPPKNETSECKQSCV